MDYRGPALLKILAAIFASALAIVSLSAVAGETSVLRAMSWLAPEGQFQALTSEPASGFRLIDDLPTSSDQILAGQIVFQTPTLLGGQAAKAGISCASCHVNGRDNPAFQFRGVSGGPGTADVTHSFFSSHRGDGQFNPVAIPDLARPGKISREKMRELEIFVRGLIVEEFDGAEPNTATLDALVAYIRALCAKCAGDPQDISLALHIDRVDQALETAGEIESREPELAYLLLSGARHQLSLIHERYAGRSLLRERKLLRALSADFVELQSAIGAGNRYQQLSRTIGNRLEEASKRLAKSEKWSLYNPERLATALQIPTPDS